MVRALTLATTPTASSAAAAALIALRHVVATPAGVLPTSRPGPAFAGDVVARLEALARAAHVRAGAVRRGALGATLGLPSAAVPTVP